MDTEKRTNDMNMDITGRRTRAKKMRRRILALTCALAIALLQCAVIMTVGTEEAHAAEDIKVSADVPKAGSSVSTSGKIEPADDDFETIQLADGTEGKGVSPSKLIEKAGIPTGNVDDYISVKKTEMIVKNGSGYDVYSKNAEDKWEYKSALPNDGIKVSMKSNYWPVKSFSINPSGTISLKEGDQKTFEAKFSLDSFFEDDESKYVDLIWSCVAGNGQASLDKTTGKKVTITVTKAGTYTIKLSNKKNADDEATVNDDGK